MVILIFVGVFRFLGPGFLSEYCIQGDEVFQEFENITSERRSFYLVDSFIFFKIMGNF